MNLTITPKPLTGTVSVVSSKSLSHRYVIAAGLALGKSVITNVLQSDDLDATKLALSKLGVTFKGVEIIGTKPTLLSPVIDCHESGSTLRFMIPIACLQNKKVRFIGSGRLQDRPLDVYFDLFNEKQIEYKKPEGKSLPLEVKGPIKAGYYKLRGDISSQFLTGLLFALPLLEEESIIELTTPLESKGYIDLTLDVLNQFGIHVLVVDQYFYIKGNQTYKPLLTSIEGDLSQAAFWMVAGLIGNQIKITSINQRTKQGDALIIDIIKQMHGSIKYDAFHNEYVINPSETDAITIDLSQIPDLGPILMVLASLSKGTTKFINASRLRIKESDRLEAMYQTLIKFGVNIVISDDEAIIEGRETLIGNQAFDSFGDHRIAMAIAIAAIRAEGNVTIINSDVVKKSYPDFYKVYQALGGQIHES
jgi:3-phosphoshikimate 1-carboxyvinyltransferase